MSLSPKMVPDSTIHMLLLGLRVLLNCQLLTVKSCRKKPTTIGQLPCSLSMRIYIAMEIPLMIFRCPLLVIARSIPKLWKGLLISWIATSWILDSSHKLPHLIRVPTNNQNSSLRLQTRIRRNLRLASLKTRHQPSQVIVVGPPDHDKISHSEWFKMTGHKPSNKLSNTQTDDSSVGSSSKPKCNSRSGSGKKKGWCNLMIHNQTSDVKSYHNISVSRDLANI